MITALQQCGGVGVGGVVHPDWQERSKDNNNITAQSEVRICICEARPFLDASTVFQRKNPPIIKILLGLYISLLLQM